MHIKLFSKFCIESKKNLVAESNLSQHTKSNYKSKPKENGKVFRQMRGCENQLKQLYFIEVKLPVGYLSSKEKNTITWIYIYSFLVSWLLIIFTDRNSFFGLKSALWSDFVFAILISPLTFLLGCFLLSLVEEILVWFIKWLKSTYWLRMVVRMALIWASQFTSRDRSEIQEHNRVSMS